MGNNQTTLHISDNKLPEGEMRTFYPHNEEPIQNGTPLVQNPLPNNQPINKPINSNGSLKPQAPPRLVGRKKKLRNRTPLQPIQEEEHEPEPEPSPPRAPPRKKKLAQSSPSISPIPSPKSHHESKFLSDIDKLARENSIPEEPEDGWEELDIDQILDPPSADEKEEKEEEQKESEKEEEQKESEKEEEQKEPEKEEEQKESEKEEEQKESEKEEEQKESEKEEEQEEDKKENQHDDKSDKVEEKQEEKEENETKVSEQEPTSPIDVNESPEFENYEVFDPKSFKLEKLPKEKTVWEELKSELFTAVANRPAFDESLIPKKSKEPEQFKADIIRAVKERENRRKKGGLHMRNIGPLPVATPVTEENSEGKPVAKRRKKSKLKKKIKSMKNNVAKAFDSISRSKRPKSIHIMELKNHEFDSPPISPVRVHHIEERPFFAYDEKGEEVIRLPKSEKVFVTDDGRTIRSGEVTKLKRKSSKKEENKEKKLPDGLENERKELMSAELEFKTVRNFTNMTDSELGRVLPMSPDREYDDLGELELASDKDVNRFHKSDEEEDIELYVVAPENKQWTSSKDTSPRSDKNESSKRSSPRSENLFSYPASNNPSNNYPMPNFFMPTAFYPYPGPGNYPAWSQPPWAYPEPTSSITTATSPRDSAPPDDIDQQDAEDELTRRRRLLLAPIGYRPVKFNPQAGLKSATLPNFINPKPYSVPSATSADSRSEDDQN